MPDPVGSGQPSVGTLLQDTRRKLEAAGLDEPDLDARLLIRHVLGLDASGLLRDAREPVPRDALARLEPMVARRLAGEPVYRIIGRRAFYDHEFLLSPDTLEPRPDTEALVDLAAVYVGETIARQGRCTLVDVGTGTGAVAVSLLALFREAVAVATDIVPGALRTAICNAEAAGVAARFLPLLADYLEPVAGSLDMVVSNPPYIPSNHINGLAREVREHDPRRALDGGLDGLDAYRALAQGSARMLSRDGWLIVEIGHGQEDDVSKIAASHGLCPLAVKRDLRGIVRALAFGKGSDRRFWSVPAKKL